MLVVFDWSVLGTPESRKWLLVSDNDLFVGLLKKLLDLRKALGWRPMSFVVVPWVVLYSVNDW